MKIHPTALIHSHAELADSVEIGAYVCIEGPARLGEGCVLRAHSILTGSVTLGTNNVIGHGTVIGGHPQDLSFNPETRSEVIIGNDNKFHEHCTVHRGATEGTATRVGNHNFFMAGSHLGHNVSVGHHSIIANNVLLGGHVHIGDRVFLGGGSGYHQHIRVGDFVITQGNSGFSKDVPPFCMGADINVIVGLNSVGLRRAGFSAELRQEVKRAFQLLYQSGRNVTQALAQARSQSWSAEVQPFFDFVAAAKKRGICDVMISKQGTSAREV